MVSLVRSSAISATGFVSFQAANVVNIIINPALRIGEFVVDGDCRQRGTETQWEEYNNEEESFLQRFLPNFYHRFRRCSPSTVRQCPESLGLMQTNIAQQRVVCCVMLCYVVLCVCVCVRYLCN